MAVPKGQATIAQRLSVGNLALRKASPEETTGKGLGLTPINRPFGTYSFRAGNPTLRRRAILGLSLRDTDSAEIANGISLRRHILGASKLPARR